MPVFHAFSPLFLNNICATTEYFVLFHFIRNCYGQNISVFTVGAQLVFSFFSLFFPFTWPEIGA